jgi:hypothetical protein
MLYLVLSPTSEILWLKGLYVLYINSSIKVKVLSGPQARSRSIMGQRQHSCGDCTSGSYRTLCILRIGFPLNSHQKGH